MALNSDNGRFESIDRRAVPRTRRSKHHTLIEGILQQVSALRGKKALKIPRTALGTAKIEHIRAALTRASGRENLVLATSSDDEYFYVWRQE
jgi:hypothetical protein